MTSANRFGAGALHRLTVGFAVRHLRRNLLTRHLACGLSYGLLVEALGLFLLLEARRPYFLAVGGEDPFWDSRNGLKRSMGTGRMMVEFWFTAISPIV